jgi:sulfite reductase alpha subunit-like flavoprotein
VGSSRGAACTVTDHGLDQFFVCGTSRVAVGVKAALQDVLASTEGLDFEQLVKGRWATDIFE